jgi:ribonucleoside-diphosphate reductase alpha chain
LYVKSNLSGEFTVVNDYLVRDLKERGLWDEVMVSDLKYFDGTLSRIDRVPADLRAIYATAFELDATWVVEAASRRQKWIDQAQSLNIYMGGASGKKLDEVYKLAWLRGLKTTYYLRTMAATHVEKSTVAHGQLNAVPSGNSGNGAGGASGANGNGFGSQGSHGSSTGGFNAAAVAAPAIAAEAEADGPVCMMRPGDAGFDECEACQ